MRRKTKIYLRRKVSQVTSSSYDVVNPPKAWMFLIDIVLRITHMVPFLIFLSDFKESHFRQCKRDSQYFASLRSSVRPYNIQNMKPQTCENVDRINNTSSRDIGYQSNDHVGSNAGRSKGSLQKIFFSNSENSRVLRVSPLAYPQLNIETCYCYYAKS